jgi:hypothetical protein
MVKNWRQRCLDNPSMMFSQAYRRAKSRADNKDIPFDITVDNMVDLFNEQNGKCFYSGMDINIVKTDENRTHDPFKMTLDCIVPESGYVKGNVVWCAYCVNSMKQKMPLEKMLKVCELIYSRSDKILKIN